MQIDEWKAVVLHQMGLTHPMTAREIAQRHNGVQAQFPSYAEDGFRSRMSAEEWAGDWRRQFVRQWSIRGTVHAYLKEEIPLYLYEGRNQGIAWLDYPSRNGRPCAREEQKYAQLILDSLRYGNKSREQLKAICREAGLDPAAEKVLFNAWGGLLAAMIFEGLIYQEYGKRSFGLLEDYRPWDRQTAQLEIARRYFSGFGPVSLNDARYYFKATKAAVEGWMKQLDLRTIEVGGTVRFYHGTLPSAAEIPDVLFVAGFDALLLAFEKRANPFLDPKFIREIYTMTGIVKPVVLLRGTIAGTWRKENGRVRIKSFIPLKTQDSGQIVKIARQRFGEMQVLWE